MIGLSLGLWQNRPSFSPLSLSPALWLDASDSTTLFQSNGGAAASADGDPVGYWLDKSASANHASQTDPTMKPSVKTGANGKNGSSVLLFDGANDHILCANSIGLTQPFTWFFVGKTDSTSSIYQAWDCVSGSRSFFGKSAATQHRFSSGTAISGGGAGGSWSYFSGTVDGASTQIYKNGATSFSGNPGAAGVGRVCVGGYNTVQVWNGNISEVLFFSGTMSAGNLALMHAYLSTKWGI